MSAHTHNTRRHMHISMPQEINYSAAAAAAEGLAAWKDLLDCLVDCLVVCLAACLTDEVDNDKKGQIK